MNVTTKKASIYSTRSVAMTFMLSFSMFISFAALTPALATPITSPMGSVLCSVIILALGQFGRALATIAVISLGVGAMLGKVSWGLALTVAGGIAVVFGAPWLATIFANDASIGLPITNGAYCNFGLVVPDTSGD